MNQLCAQNNLNKRARTKKNTLRWLERVLVFFDALYLGVKIVRLELANHDQILLQNNDSIKVSIFGRFLKKFVAMATQLGLEV